MRLRLITCLFICSVFGQQILAQETKPASTNGYPPQSKDFWDKFYVGGNIGLQFGTVTVVDIEPQFGYRITERLISGIGVSYIYYHFKDATYNYTFSTNIYGGSLFSKYLITDNLFAHVEFKALNLEVLHGITSYPGYEIAREWIPFMFVGGGYKQPVGERASLQFLILYDVIEDRNSPYQNPIISAGFGIGF